MDASVVTQEAVSGVITTGPQPKFVVHHRIGKCYRPGSPNSFFEGKPDKLKALVEQAFAENKYHQGNCAGSFVVSIPADNVRTNIIIEGGVSGRKHQRAGRAEVIVCTLETLEAKRQEYAKHRHNKAVARYNEAKALAAKKGESFETPKPEFVPPPNRPLPSADYYIVAVHGYLSQHTGNA